MIQRDRLDLRCVMNRRHRKGEFKFKVCDESGSPKPGTVLRHLGHLMRGRV